jgi:DNA-binding transcriptional LysR family regulator
MPKSSAIDNVQAYGRPPRVILESGSPHCLLTFAETGHGIAIVPSTVVIPRGRFRVVPVVQGDAALGFWTVVCWDARRFLPSYGEQFVEELVAYTRHTHPGRRFGRAAPPVRPPEPPKVRSG